ncbi:MAG: helix-turn-helix domain-containing protein [Candidatus Aenigmatarchaeota archaeon]
MRHLTNIGLTENESKVYLALLAKGAMSANHIYEETGIYRRNIYDILNKLISKGLATFVIENKKKVFQATDPRRIITFLEEQKKSIEDKEKIVRDILPELEKKFRTKTSSIEAEIYRGEEGIKTLFEDTLNHKEVLFIGAGAYIYLRLPDYWLSYNRRRLKLAITWKILALESIRNVKMLNEKYVQTRFLPKEFSGPNVIWIYGNKVANVVWIDVPIAFVINNKEISDNYKKYFNLLWNKVAKR